MAYGKPVREVNKMLKKDLIQEVRDKTRENASLHNALNAQKRIHRFNSTRPQESSLFRLIKRSLEFTALLTFCVWAWSIIIPGHTDHSIIVGGLSMVALLWTVVITYVLFKGLIRILRRFSWIRKLYI